MLKNWIKLTGQNKQEDENIKVSHLLLDGGKLYVKEENNEAFIRKYSEAIINGEKQYVVECKKEYFKLFFDLDFMINSSNIEKKNKINEDLNKEVINYEESKECNEIFDLYLKNINETIEQIYGKDKICIVTTADIKKITKIVKNDEEPNKVESDIYFKKGFHLHYPNIIVNTETALKLRKNCIYNINYIIKTVYGNSFKCLKNTVTDIIDEKVFKGSGLRMTGSRKGQITSTEFIDEGRPYELKDVIINGISNKKQILNFKNNYTQLVLETSIVSFEKTMTKQENNIEKLNYDDCELSPDESECNSGGWSKLDKSSVEYRTIIDFFRNTIMGYSENDIKRIYVSDNQKIYLLNSRSRYCQNIGRNHNSEHIYFLLSKDGMVQKCFCRCNTMDGRKDGYCKDYSSNKIPCSAHLNKKLGFKTNKNEVNYKIDTSGSVNSLIDSLRSDFQVFFTNQKDLKIKQTKSKK